MTHRQGNLSQQKEYPGSKLKLTYKTNHQQSHNVNTCLRKQSKALLGDLRCHWTCAAEYFISFMFSKGKSRERKQLSCTVFSFCYIAHGSTHLNQCINKEARISAWGAGGPHNGMCLGLLTSEDTMIWRPRWRSDVASRRGLTPA